MEFNSVVLGSVEELAVVIVSVIVIFGFLHVEVGDPAQLSENVSVQGNLRIFWYTGSFNLVFFVGVELASWH